MSNPDLQTPAGFHILHVKPVSYHPYSSLVLDGGSTNYYNNSFFNVAFILLDFKPIFFPNKILTTTFIQTDSQGGFTFTESHTVDASLLMFICKTL